MQNSHLAAKSYAATSPPHAQSTASLPTNALSRALLLVSTAPWGDDRAYFLCRGTNSRLASPLPLHSRAGAQMMAQLVRLRAQGQARNMNVGKVGSQKDKGKTLLGKVLRPRTQSTVLRPGTQSTAGMLLPPCIQEPEVRQQLQAAQALCGEPQAVAHAQTLQPAAGPAGQLWRNRLSCRWGHCW